MDAKDLSNAETGSMLMSEVRCIRRRSRCMRRVWCECDVGRGERGVRW
jgi:hypothetical protein